MVEWGLDKNSFKSTDFTEMALIHPDDEITTPQLVEDSIQDC